MSSDSTYLQMFSTLTAEGELRLELKEQPMPIPGENEVLIRIEATPINPSDHGVMFGWASMASAIIIGQRCRHSVKRAGFRARHGSDESKNRAIARRG